ncbi:hypothetical protein Spico_0199 [Parasphaerochaeta coccoides DSM 17374]|uniref:Uncharacterized protein n=1 Tax=Parasphaerochaeta coccoides (strain ATCC BAA-1237 / DSM 17374 / SPN1) TaxID=760011 RepID=F4GKM6_PARC1|nr:hypothetical protein Spico_0199 [Parasphaerochaeta coccoides DSM 17374]
MVNEYSVKSEKDKQEPFIAGSHQAVSSPVRNLGRRIPEIPCVSCGILQQPLLFL